MHEAELFALFGADGPADEDGERTQAAIRLFITMRDWPHNPVWIVPCLGEEYAEDQERIALAILSRFPERSLEWPDNGAGSAHLVLLQ